MNEELTVFKKYQKFYPGMCNLSQKFFFLQITENIRTCLKFFFKGTCDLNSELTT